MKLQQAFLYMPPHTRLVSPVLRVWFSPSVLDDAILIIMVAALIYTLTLDVQQGAETSVWVYGPLWVTPVMYISQGENMERWTSAGKTDD